jgi:hypothetical protein
VRGIDGLWTRRLLPLALALLGPALTSPAAAQGGGPRLRAHLTTGVVRLGERVNLMISVEGARDAKVLALPSVDGLELGPLSRRNQNSYTSHFNGRTSSFYEFVWALPVRALRAGEFVIPSFEVQMDGETARTPPLALTAVQDMLGEELGHFEILRSSDRVVEGQPFSIELRFGWDLALEGRINSANLSLPWWEALPGVLTMEPGPARPGVRTQTLGLNGTERVNVDEIEPQTVRGKPYRTFRLLRSFTASRTGKLEFPTSFLEFGSVPEDSFFAQRRTRPESYFVQAPAFAIEVVPLPEAGRPLSYGGAIGSLSLRADAQPRDVDAGESIKLTLSVTGQGNLEFFTAPELSRAEAFDGFRHFGATESKSFDRREIVYDLAPLSSSVTEIPPVELPVFDPGLGRYVVLKSEPIPIRVRALEKVLALSGDADAESFERDIRDLHDAARDAASSGRPGAAWTAGALSLGPLLWLGLVRVRRSRADARAPLERRRRRALGALARRLAAADGARGELDALWLFLAERTRESEAAWVGRDVEDHARRHPEVGLSPQGAARLAALIGELERAAWGGGGEKVGGEDVLALARNLVKEGL